VYTLDINKQLLESVVDTAPMKDTPTSQFIIPASPRPFIQPMLYADTKPPIYNKLNPDRVAKIVDARQDEIRAIAEDVATSLLRDIINSAEVNEYTQGILSLPNSGLKLSDNYEVVGERPASITFQDIVPEMSLEDATIDALKSMGYSSVRRPDDGNSNNRPIVEEKSYNISISSLTEGFVKLGISKKGHSMAKIDELLIEQYGTKSGGKVVNVRKLVESMSPKLGSFLRNKILKMQTQSSVNKVNIENPKDNPTEMKQQDHRSEEKDGALELAIAIQRANQMIGDRAKVDKMRERDEEEKANALLANPYINFLHDMDDILRNTMFNLVQEAINDEYSVISEPIKFLSSPDRERTGSNIATLSDF